MAKDGLLFLLPLVAMLVVNLLFGWYWMAGAFFVLAAFVAFFFRDPRREIPEDPDAIVSPADGRVIRVRPEGGRTRIVIFLSILDVHVNRAPVDGPVVQAKYQPGKFHVAWDDRASLENEQLIITIGDRRPITFSLIAGLVARRIVFYRKLGEKLEKGDRIALIRFGSRVDIFIPSECEVLVTEGDRVRGGSSILARWKAER